MADEKRTPKEDTLVDVREALASSTVQVFVAGCIGFALSTLANSPLVFESRLLWFLGHQLPAAIEAFYGGFPSFGADLDDLFVLLTIYVVSTALGLVAIEATSRAVTTVLARARTRTESKAY